MKGMVKAVFLLSLLVFPPQVFSQENADFLHGVELPRTQGKDYALSFADHEVHTYTGYTLCYRESFEQAEWVAYERSAEELVKVTGRTNDFRPDTLISTGSAELSDYKRSGYDRGHLAPAADMRWSEQAMHDCFLLSNISPQVNEFNAGIWNDLENFVRTAASRFDGIWVVTGPVLEKQPEEYKSVGANKVSVPEYFYKVLLVKKENKKGEGVLRIQDKTYDMLAVGFIIPNEVPVAKYWDYAVTVDQIEARTGLDFFYKLPDELEEKIESAFNRQSWTRK